MTYSKLTLTAAAALLACGCATTPRTRTATRPNVTPSSASAALNPQAINAAATAATQQVISTERTFAKSMADRNFKAFVTFLSPEATFFSASSVKHGAAEVAEQWRSYFDGPKAPFSWAPDHVEVLPSGTLALSTGPIYQQGKIVGRYNSIWRLEAANTWHIVFDKGEAVCGIAP